MEKIEGIWCGGIYVYTYLYNITIIISLLGINVINCLNPKGNYFILCQLFQHETYAHIKSQIGHCEINQYVHKTKVATRVPHTISTKSNILEK